MIIVYISSKNYQIAMYYVVVSQNQYGILVIVQEHNFMSEWV